MKEEIKTNLSNYYGTVGFRKIEAKYSMFLDDYSREREIEIPKEMYEIAKKYFAEISQPN